MGFIVRLLITTGLVVLLANILPGVQVDSFTTGLWVAVALGLLNMFLKPILVIFTLPATILTLGLFLFVINALIIQSAAYFVNGFVVEGFWYAMLFSIILTFCQSVVNGFLQKDEPRRG
ncbi:phage holin family protein [Myroides marinus]|uniref:phage holin family protein n=1 Tax=Myroides marinus TaxID=703342 RepID=UPI002577B5B0|nr:phage holin family protein [Myroides marinus]MDM1371250.1 phage holin family protein [Myroides marinus]MDM1389962.1 phage holin family protein [Myroides marinus]MDM1403457.1 phage holin family protein [Myroides marinus]MDM1533909.1 phage holin family protein [Myroides marinus]MDM1540873.1 phage holin family protein [Myroides marinus]